MRVQQKSFVIEYKSRRQTTAKDRSIWGAVDFRKLAADVEQDVPQLFAGHPNDECADSAAQTGTTSSDFHPSERGPEEALGADTIDTSAVSEEIDHVDPGSAGGKEDVDKARTRKSRHPRGVGKVSRVVAEFLNGSVAPTDDQDDELTVLESENRELKALLSSRLRDQNLLLRSMLQRFPA